MSPMFSSDPLRRRALLLLVLFLCVCRTAVADAPSYHYMAVSGSSNGGGTTAGRGVRFSENGAVLLGLPGSGSQLGKGFKAVLGAGAPVVTGISDGTPVDISADGSVILAGFTRRAGAATTDVRPANQNSIVATALSADGSVVAGQSYDKQEDGGRPRVWRWTSGTGAVLFEMPENTSSSGPPLLSEDGQHLYSMVSILGANGSQTTGLFHWSADGTRTQVTLPPGYRFIYINTPAAEAAANDGTVVVLVEKYSFTGIEERAILRWSPTASTLIPLPKFFGMVSDWSPPLISRDGSVLVIDRFTAVFRHAGGVFTEIGDFTPTSLNRDGTVIFGSMSADFRGALHAAVWTQASGAVDLMECFGRIFQTPVITEAYWTSQAMGIRGDNVVFAGRDHPSRGNGRVVLAEISLASLAAAETFTGNLLADGPTVKASVALKETEVTRAVRRYEPPDQGFPGFYYLDTVSSSSASLRLAFSMEGEDITALNFDTPVELLVGTRLIFKGKLGDAGNGGFTPGNTTAEFANGALKLSWDQKTAVFDWKAVSYLTPEYLSAITGTTTRTLGGSLPIRARFGTRDGLRRMALSGTFTQRFVRDGEDSVRVNNFQLKGTFAVKPPVLTVSGPKDGSAFNQRDVFIGASNSAGVAIYARLNGGEWVNLGSSSVALTLRLEPGDSLLELEARDALGNVSPIVRRTYTYQPRAGSYTALLYDGEDVAGFVTIVLQENGAFTGKLTVDGKAFPMKGTLDAGAAASVVVSRGKSLPALTLALGVSAATGTSILTAGVELPGAQPTTIAGTAARTNWSRALASRIDTFHGYAHLRPGPGLPDALGGTGYLSANVRVGAVKLLGRLADGTPFTGSGPLTETYAVPVFISSSKTRTELFGVLNFDPDQPDSDFTGQLRWKRDAGGPAPFSEALACNLAVKGCGSSLNYGTPYYALRFTGAGLAAPLRFVVFGNFTPVTPTPLLSLRHMLPYVYSGIKGKVTDALTGNVFTFEAVYLSKSNEFAGCFFTPAGSGAMSIDTIVGADDGPAASAKFNGPDGLAFDAAGNLYISEMNNFTIRKLTPGGQVSTLAGKAGQSGTVEGTGPAARFQAPGPLVCDAAGNLYVGDRSQRVIRKVTPAGTTSLLAGTLAGAGFGYMNGIAFDGVDLYVADYGLKKVTLAGAVTTLADNFYTMGVCVSGPGEFYVAKTFSVGVFKDGQLRNLAGKEYVVGKSDGLGEKARFSGIGGMATDNGGNLVLADNGSHTIRKVTPGGVVTTIAGQPGRAGFVDGTAAMFREPRGIAFDSAGNLYIADSGNHVIRKLSPSGEVTTVAGPH